MLTDFERTTLQRFALEANKVQRHIEGRLTVPGLSESTRAELVRAAQSLSLLAHDLREAAGCVDAVAA